MAATAARRRIISECSSCSLASSPRVGGDEAFAVAAAALPASSAAIVPVSRPRRRVVCSRSALDVWEGSLCSRSGRAGGCVNAPLGRFCSVMVSGRVAPVARALCMRGSFSLYCLNSGFRRRSNPGVRNPAEDGPARLWAHALDIRVPPLDLSGRPPRVGGVRFSHGASKLRRDVRHSLRVRGGTLERER
jgi:hypothetical protein